MLGAAVAARAAHELSTGTGMPALTVARLLSHAEHPAMDGQPRGLPQRVVLIVDEAGMLGTRPLARLLHHVHNAGGCLVLVGDHHQLPELDAGGAFAALAHRLDPVVLHTNHRQEQPWERAALDELRTGDVPTALAAYDHHGRLHLHDTAEDQRTALVAAWWDRTTAGWQRLWQPAWQPIWQRPWQPNWQRRPPPVGTARCSCWPPAAPTSTTSTAAPAPCWPPTAT